MTENVTNKKMVCGFLFTGKMVLLVKKTRQSWQAGLLNGVGGVIEDSETPIEAMVREFREETGVLIPSIDWCHFATEQEPFGAWVYFFTAKLLNARSNFDWPETNDVGEQLQWGHVVDLFRTRNRMIGNLTYLIAMAMDPRGFKEPVLIRTAGDIRECASW